MPDKLRKRGTRIVKHRRSPVAIEETIRKEFNAERRSAWWWNGDRGPWPNIWMTFAQKYKMPIAQIKNIVGYQGITNRPLPAPLTEEQIRQRQEKRGDFLADLWRRRYASDFYWSLKIKERSE